MLPLSPISILRIICNHWCKVYKSYPCCFGCGYFSDRVSHASRCPRFMEVFFSTCCVPYPGIKFEDIVLLHGAWIGQSVHRARFMLIASHICFLCFNACRHGIHFSPRLVLHKLYSYTRKHTKAAIFIRRFKYYERDALG